METAPITAWTLIQEIPIPDDVTDLLIDGEKAAAAYKTTATARSSPTSA